jgi:hypothetical protein
MYIQQRKQELLNLFNLMIEMLYQIANTRTELITTTTAANANVHSMERTKTVVRMKFIFVFHYFGVQSIYKHNTIFPMY